MCNNELERKDTEKKFRVPVTKARRETRKTKFAYPAND